MSHMMTSASTTYPTENCFWRCSIVCSSGSRAPRLAAAAPSFRGEPDRAQPRRTPLGVHQPEPTQEALSGGRIPPGPVRGQSRSPLAGGVGYPPDLPGGGGSCCTRVGQGDWRAHRAADPPVDALPRRDERTAAARPPVSRRGLPADSPESIVVPWSSACRRRSRSRSRWQRRSSASARDRLSSRISMWRPCRADDLFGGRVGTLTSMIFRHRRVAVHGPRRSRRILR